MDSKFLFDQTFEEHMAVARACADTLRDPFARFVDVCAGALRDGRKLLFFGNGGSAADAQHIATELTVRFERNRAAMAALALTTDSSALTAIGNDFGFERLFARQIEAIGAPGDVAVGITTSGRSANITAALRTARERGLVAAGLSGRDGGDLRGLADPLLIVPADSTARIQEMHITLGHMLCAALERQAAA
ncbi:SIS domain-containing protein [Arenibaculum pallidiluteum]|uniref:SIS domain-containing protein n=1 Tax=Arenibaculum pallidiluteum TaxID=2812559 RepID=UPI001A96150A|nr:SIS domain-containing protein [Arenibaculum pallidiluteum]